ncbi:MAG: hypothetical protein IPJ17_08800 [Holophagales bacterium]|nr:MAG: hypothetical protein IPJ17_08800 [Holophagales bacterium]
MTERPPEGLRVRDLIDDLPSGAPSGVTPPPLLPPPAESPSPPSPLLPPMLPQVVVETGGNREEASAGLPFDPRLLLLGIWRRRLQVAAIAGLVAFAAVAVALLTRTREWQVWVTILRKREQKEFLVTSNTPIVKLQVYSMPTVLRLVKVNENLRAVIDGLKLGVEPAALSQRIRVENPKDTDLVEILVTWPDRQQAVEIANTLGRAFVANVDRLQKLEAIQAYDYLSTQLAETRARTGALEQQLVAFKEKNGVVKLSEQAGRLIEKLSEFESLAEKERLDAGMAADAMRTTRDELAKQSGTVVASTYVKKPVQVRLLELQTRLADLLSVYTEESAQVLELRDDIARVEELARQGLEEQLYEKTVSRNPVLSVLEQALVERTVEAASREARAAGYAAVRDRFRAELLQLPEVEAQLARLQQDLDTLSEVEKTLAARVEEVRIIRDSTAANFSIMQEARLPDDPVPGKAKLIVALGLLLGVALGVAVALGRELLDSRLKASSEVERALGTVPLGEIPELAAQQLPLVVTTAGAPGSEAFRELLTQVLLRRPEKGNWTLLLSGASHLEGRTTVALNLAFAAAQRGLDVCVVDASPRKPSLGPLAPRLGLDVQAPGLVAALRGEVDAVAALQRPVNGGPWFLTVDERRQPAHELFAGPAAAQVLAALAARFPLVLLDGPPVLAGTEALLAAPLVDGILFVAEAHGEPRAAHREALARLGTTRTPVIGTILNRVQTAYLHRFAPRPSPLGEPGGRR